MDKIAEVQALGYHVKREFLAAVMESTEFPTSQSLIEFLKSSDFRRKDMMSPYFPDTLASQAKIKLEGQAVLQIVSVVDVSLPLRKHWRQGVDRGRSSRILSILLTDGHSKVPGMEVAPIPAMHIDISPGTKVLYIGSSVRNGRLLLTEANLKLVGGEVPHLRETWLANKMTSRLKQIAQLDATSTKSSGEKKPTVGPPNFILKLSAQSDARQATGPTHNKQPSAPVIATSTVASDVNNESRARKAKKSESKGDISKQDRSERTGDYSHEQRVSGGHQKAAERTKTGGPNSESRSASAVSELETHQPAHRENAKGGRFGGGNGRGRGHESIKERNRDKTKDDRSRQSRKFRHIDAESLAQGSVEFDFPELPGSNATPAVAAPANASTGISYPPPPPPQKGIDTSVMVSPAVVVEPPKPPSNVGSNAHNERISVPEVTKLIKSSLGITPCRSESHTVTSTPNSNIVPPVAGISSSVSSRNSAANESSIRSIVWGPGSTIGVAANSLSTSSSSNNRDLKQPQRGVGDTGSYSLMDFMKSQPSRAQSQGHGKGPNRSKVVAMTPWNCRQCTFSNHGALKQCEMCGAAK